MTTQEIIDELRSTASQDSVLDQAIETFLASSSETPEAIGKEIANKVISELEGAGGEDR